MLNLREQCDKLCVAYPPELVEYFRGTEALDMATRSDATKAVIEVDLEYDLKIDGLVQGRVCHEDGMLIDLAKLPDDIALLRIYLS